jgi:hypothetical protein
MFAKNSSGTSPAENIWGAIGKPVTNAIGGAYDWASDKLFNAQYGGPDVKPVTYPTDTSVDENGMNNQNYYDWYNTI